uniref:Uncharacterized protein n=1 Tax=Arundo donax TaxID=35708 RepID=A0A0A9ANY5_ARUDO
MTATGWVDWTTRIGSPQTKCSRSLRTSGTLA